MRHEKGWTTNGVGRKFNHKFGYGLLDAGKIVRFAEKWSSVPPARICEVTSQNKEREISSKLRKQLEVSLLTNGCRGSPNEIRYLEHVQCKITLKYQPRGNLKISLISPSGTISHLLFPRPRDVDEISFNAWPFLSVHFWGERPSGTWRLIIQNDGSKPAIFPGKLFSWSLIFYGTYEKPLSFLYNETLRYFPRSTSPATTSLNDCAVKGFLKQYESDKCVQNCEYKQWANADLGQCLPCNDVCDSCFGPSSDNCLSCSSGYFFNYHCLDKCPDGYYEDKDLKECLPCLRNCLTCSETAQNCTQCRVGLFLDQNNHCLPDLKMSQPSNTTKCSDFCQVCDDTSPSTCIQCEENRILYNGNCIVDSCPDGHFAKKTNFSTECVS